MAVPSNKLTPLLAVAAIGIIGTIVYMQFSDSSKQKAGEVMQQIPTPSALPETKGADQDTSAETLNTVVAGNKRLQDDVQRVLKENKELRDENKRIMQGRPVEPVRPSLSTEGATSPAQSAGNSSTDVFSRALDTASAAVGAIAPTMPGGVGSTGGVPPSPGGTPEEIAAPQAGRDAAHRPSLEPDTPTGEISYKLIAPMGYVAQTSKPSGAQGITTTRFVRTTVPSSGSELPEGEGPASRAAQAAAAKVESVPYFTIPENGTMAGVTAMTSIIGRVPIDGRVTDPMQFKAIIGRDNLAANGWEMPDDLAGMIVTGIAIGDMALSCSEGKVRSMTFVFNDGTIRTVSSRRGNRSGTAGGTGDDLGFISDEHGNPCIQGKFVTNAPAYLTDLVGVKALGVASQAFADAERTVRSNSDGSITSAVTGSASNFALGQAASGATDEITKWLTSRLKNSFDAVVTPSGRQLVVHLDQEIRVDKATNGRKLTHRNQTNTAFTGARYGLE